MGIRNRVRVIPVLLALSLVGCGSDSGTGITTNCGVAGTSNVNVTGTVTASVNECAIYVVSTGGSPATSIALTGGLAAATTHSIAVVRNGARPAVGSFTIGSGTTPFEGVFTFDGGGGADRTFILISGTINITASSAGTLSGTFVSVTATEETASGNLVTLSGSFTAKCVDTANNDC